MKNVIKKIENHGIKLTLLKSEENFVVTTTKALYNSRYYSSGDTVEVTVNYDLTIQLRGAKRISCKYFTVDEFINYFLTEEIDTSIIESDFVNERHSLFYDLSRYLKSSFKENKLKISYDIMRIKVKIKHYSRFEQTFIIQIACYERQTFNILNIKTMKTIFDEYSKEEIHQIVNNKMFKKGVCSNCGVTHKEALIREKNNEDICVYCHYDYKGLY